MTLNGVMESGVSIYELTNLKLMPYLLYTLYSIGALINLEPKIVLT